MGDSKGIGRMFYMKEFGSDLASKILANVRRADLKRIDTLKIIIINMFVD